MRCARLLPAELGHKKAQSLATRGTKIAKISGANMATIEKAANSPIGRDTLRIDGPYKVTGLAQYTSDFNFPGMLYAVPVEATIANGKLLTLDTSAAERMPGVRAIFHRGNIG